MGWESVQKCQLQNITHETTRVFVMVVVLSWVTFVRKEEKGKHKERWDSSGVKTPNAKSGYDLFMELYETEIILFLHCTYSTN